MIIARMLLLANLSQSKNNSHFEFDVTAYRRWLSKISLVALLLVGLNTPVQAQTCPDLSQYYPGQQPDWSATAQTLIPLMPQCLLSTEYFALLGAAQLNSGATAGALESLERALLLDPANGGAQVDYAQALYQQGQLFAALDMNRQLLERDDLPQDLRPMLKARQSNWESLTRQKGVRLDVLAGYDNNLNGAPEPGQITLTLSGEPIELPLSEQFRPVSGPYLNLRLVGQQRRITPEYQHNFLAEVRGRVSEDSESDLLQVDTRYGFVNPGTKHNWQFNAGLSHLFFGGSPLYSATQVSARYAPKLTLRCEPYLIAATQHQLYHNQSRLNAIESKAGSGLNCPLENAWGRQLLTAELSYLSNDPIKAGRPGSGRKGWQFNMGMQWQLSSGILSTQFNHTELDDDVGYSPLLDDGARRWVNRSYVLVQYQRPLRRDTVMLFNLFHQTQRSNIELFRTNDNTVEIGVSHAF